MSILSCPACEEKFAPSSALQKFCSVKCRDRVHYLRKKAAGSPQSRYLRKKADGTGYVPRDRQAPSNEKSCAECGASFVGHGNQKFCATICNYRAKERRRVEAGYYQQEHVKQRVNALKRTQYRQDIESGKESGKLLKSWAEYGVDSMADISSVCVLDGCSRPKFARLKCKPHYEREMRLAGAEWAHYNEISGNDYRRRAEKFGVPFEQFNKFDIYDRDGWKCGLCSEPVDSELMYPDPMSVSLDHIVPLSRGGAHSPANTQCSHLSCNVRKGARHGEEVGTGMRVS